MNMTSAYNNQCNGTHTTLLSAGSALPRGKCGMHELQRPTSFASSDSLHINSRLLGVCDSVQRRTRLEPNQLEKD